MYKKKLHISKIFSNLEFSIFMLYNLVMCNLYTKIVKFLEIFKEFSEDLVTESEADTQPHGQSYRWWRGLLLHRLKADRSVTCGSW